MASFIASVGPSSEKTPLASPPLAPQAPNGSGRDAARADRATPAATSTGAATPSVQAPPRGCDAYEGPFVAPRPTPHTRVLGERLANLLPALARATQTVLQHHTDWQLNLAQLEVSVTDRAGLRSALRNTEGLGHVAAFLLSWVLPCAYVPGLGKVLVVAPNAQRTTNPHLRYALACTMVAAAIGQVHHDFYDHVARRLIAVRVRDYDIYACRAWAHALAISVATEVAPEGIRPPWWQRLANFCLWPVARLLIGPQRLARRFVPILAQVREERPALVDRMFAHRSLCSVLYSAPGPRLLVHNPSPGYRRPDFSADVRYLRAFNPRAGAISFSAES